MQTNLQKSEATVRPPRWQSNLYGQLIVWATKLVKAGLVDLRLSGEEYVFEALRQGRPVLFAGWHGHNFLTMCSYYEHLQHYFKGTVIMVPDNSNGRVLDRFGKKIHFDVIKVNSELGPSQWARATVSMIKLIRNGYCALLSPDGPDGPVYKVKPGVATIGQQSKAVIIPASAAVERGFKMRSRWDEHLIPHPFTRAVVHFGKPIDPTPADGPMPTPEELQEAIEAALIRGALEAEEICRRKPRAKGRA